MKETREDVAATIGQSEEIVDMLDMVLTEAADRAYVVCSAEECLKNVKGQCTIHMVKARRKIPGSGRCAEYVS